MCPAFGLRCVKRVEAEKQCVGRQFYYEKKLLVSGLFSLCSCKFPVKNGEKYACFAAFWPSRLKLSKSSGRGGRLLDENIRFFKEMCVTAS